MVNLESYSDREFLAALQPLISSLVVDTRLAPSDSPQAILLGGQSGAGKTTLHNVFLAQQQGNAIVVNGDDYRSVHPRFHQIAAQYGIDSPAHTAAWAGRMVEAVVDALSVMGYNLIIKGTLRTSEVPLKTATLLRSRGYGVSLALMAVKPEISLVSCQLRYEQMRLAGMEPRAVNPAHHRNIVEGIVSNLKTLEESGLFDAVALYDRSERRLFCSEEGDGRASEALAEIFFGDWTAEETRHCEYLQKRLEEMRSRSE